MAASLGVTVGTGRLKGVPQFSSDSAAVDARQRLLGPGLPHLFGPLVANEPAQVEQRRDRVGAAVQRGFERLGEGHDGRTKAERAGGRPALAPEMHTKIAHLSQR